MLKSIRSWLALRQGNGRRKVARQRQRSFLRTPHIDPLEDRRLFSVSGATVVGRSVFYNNSQFDGYTPAATAGDWAAIATDKVALRPGQTATFANYTSALAGINGVVIDIAGLTGTPTADDFLFHVGNNTALGSWAEAPRPSSFAVHAGAGVGGSTRVTIVWPDGLIRNQWLQVDVRVTGNTGLAQPDVFYFGNAVGDTGNSPLNTLVNMTDQLAVRANTLPAGQVAPIASRYDFNRDGLINTTDERIAASFSTNTVSALQLLKPTDSYVWSDVVSRSVFYNNSSFDGNQAGANAADDGAIALDKRALLPGQTASFANYTSYFRGINGVMIDIAGSPQTLTADDFEFRVGNDAAPALWAQAPQPSSISMRYGAGVGGSTRVMLVWPDGAIARTWLQVTVKATSRTRLAAADVFYFGNSVGETGDSNSTALVNTSDLLRVSGGQTTGAVGVQSVLDINRDNRVDGLDRELVLANLNTSASALKLIELGPPISIEPAAQAPFEPVYTNFIRSEVVGRGIFYNSSHLDGNSPLASAADFNAIASDKRALMPGETASFANYTSSSRGINGILVDITGLPGELTASDFIFRVGNSSTPSQWAIAPAPLSVTLSRGAGQGGSDRITIVWADNAIQNQWLQVTVKALATTGLQRPEVFYFGNAVGETGNSPSNARVDMNDRLQVRNKFIVGASGVSADNRYDFNRDGIVDASDEQIAARAAAVQPLQLIAAPLEPDDAQSQRLPLELFHRGDSGYNVFFGPNLVRTGSGTILALAEARWAPDDPMSFAIVQRRSTDGGATWSEITTVAGIPPFTTDTISNASAVVDSTTGEIFVVYVKNWSLVFVTSSNDDGLSWSPPIEITSSVKVTSQGNPNPSVFPDTPWGWYVVGPGHGIQLQQGANAGRLVIAGDHRISEDRSTPSWSHVIYSDDHGRTWHLGGGVDQSVRSNRYANEATVVEQSDGGLYMSIRMNNGSPFRGYSRSYDGGLTWSDVQMDERLTTFGVQASLLRVDANTVLLSAPDSSDGTRRQMTIWISRDNMQTWVKTKAVYYSYAGYSDMTLSGPHTVLLAYNRGNAAGNSAQSIGLARFDLEWLEDGQSDQFLWHFNEQAIGTKANLDGPSIQDYSPWDNRAQALASTPEAAPTYVAGPGGNVALRLTAGSDSVMLTPASTQALQFGAQDSFTIELSMRTTATGGVIIGGTPGARGWTLRLVSGRPRLELFDGTTTALATGNVAINDGNWHRVSVVRDAESRQIRVYVDGVLSGAPVADTTSASLISNGTVTLGAMNNGSGQMALDIDTLRITRGALNSNQLLSALLAEPPRYQAPPFRQGAPNTLPNLQLWLPSYDPTRNFADLGYADPVPLAPVSGTAVRSVMDASPNGFRATVGTTTREVMYANDSVVGPHWNHAALTSSAGEPWIVQNSSGASPTNFDFVQNTGVFTLSVFVKVGSNFGANRVLFDTAESKSTNSGFSLLVTPQGALTTLIVGQPGSIRFNQTTAEDVVLADRWYHIAVVGSGPGNPLKYYVTQANDPTVNSFQTSRVILGSNGNYATDADHNLTIGALARTGQSSFNGQMVDQAIYNRALSAAEIQQLYNYTMSG